MKQQSNTQKQGALTHPTGEIVEIVGINSNTNGRSCEEHDTCGRVLAEDTLI